MKLVAAAKVRRAQEAVLRSRPFSETLERILGGLLQRVKTEGLDLPLLEARTVKKVGLVSITGDRGLCGAYNSAAIKQTEARIEALKEQGIEVELLFPSFISMISSVPQVRTLVPLLPSGMEMEGDEIFKLTSKDGDMAIEKEKVPAAAPAEFVP